MAGVALLQIPILPDKLDEACKIACEHPHGLAYTASQPGFLGLVCACNYEENTLIFMEKWVKADDWKTYGATREVKEGELGEKNAAWGGAIGPLFAGTPDMGSLTESSIYCK